MISAFVRLLFACAQVSSSDIDIIRELPVEISSTIFRYLDSESLVNAASVNRHWNSVCRNDAVLKKRIHKRLRREHKSRIEAYMKPSKTVKIVRLEGVPAVQFGVRNGNVSVQKLPVRYEAPKFSSNIKSQVKNFAVSLGPNGKRSLLKQKKSKINFNNNVTKTRNLRF